MAALPEIPVTRIFELRRDDRDQTYWHELAELSERGRLGVVLTTWLYANDLPAGSFRAERDGKRLEVTWTGDELLAA